jgi:hypothetical protein
MFIPLSSLQGAFSTCHHRPSIVTSNGRATSSVERFKAQQPARTNLDRMLRMIFEW